MTELRIDSMRDLANALHPLNTFVEENPEFRFTPSVHISRQEAIRAYSSPFGDLYPVPPKSGFWDTIGFVHVYVDPDEEVSVSG